MYFNSWLVFTFAHFPCDVTVECAALLRYFGLRAVIVDFHGNGDVVQQSKDTVSGNKRSSDDMLSIDECKDDKAVSAGINLITDHLRCSR